MKRFQLAFVLLCSLSLTTVAFAQTGILRTERAPTSVVTFTESADFLGLSSTHFIDGYVKRDGTGRFIFPVGHGSKAGPFAADGGGIIGAYFAESSGSSVVSGGPFSPSDKTDEIQTVSVNEYWHIDGALATTLAFAWNSESAVAALTGSMLQKLSIVGWNATNKRWEKIPSQVDAVSVLGGSSTLNAGSISTNRPIVPNSYEVFTLAALTNSVAPSNFVGKLEVADCRSISGWVYDKNNTESELVVEVIEGTTVHTQILANTFRSDLQSLGIGSGKYGFSISLPEDLRDGNYRNLSIRVRGSEFILDGSPKSVGCGYRGKFETADCYAIKGWTVIGEYPDSSLVVDFLADGQLQGSFSANLFRADIQSQIGGSGKVGFEFALPNSVKTNVPRQISLRAKNSRYVLEGSPKTLQCAIPQPSGSFDVADCTGLKGWVWDKTYPSSTLTVEILEGGAVVASGLANIYRADLKSMGYGTGNYAFNIPLPVSLKDGQAHQLSARVKGSTFLLTASPRALTCLPEVYGGSFEEVDCNSVRGWAWDKNRPEANVNVELLADGVVVGSAVAKAYRADLKTAGYGTGNYGFSIPLPSNLKDGQAHSYSVRIQGTSYVLGGSPRSATCAVPSQYSGSFDVADCTGLKGWVWDKTYPSSTLTVEILEGGAVVASGLANIYRADLKSMGYGTGNYAFNIPLPVSLKDGQAHQLSARVKGSTFLLTASPRAMTCLPEVYGGSFEEVDCNSVRGWAWDKNRPEANVNVELLADGVVVGSAVAKAYRADLKTAGYGTGNYGFSIPLPSNLKDGQAHSYSVRIQGTSYVLGGSPRSATCAVPSQYSGSFDVADCTGLKGWVWDKTYPSSTLTVEILEGGAVVASGLANIYRADLKSMGYGTGNYAFNIPLPVSLKDGQAHQLSARVKGSTFLLTASPRAMTCLPEVYGGSFEEVDCNSVRGWAWDKNRPEANVNVELLADGVVVGSAVAKAYRADLKTAGYGTGNYGFSIPLPSNLKDGQAHSYSVRIQGTSYVLGGSPRSATCAVPSQYSGSFDVADCTGLKGWVWDKTYPSSTLTVEILEGGAVVASGLANIYRADLKSMGYGTGNYAFNIPLPVSLKDGQAHQLSARVKGSTFLLTASPRAMTCLPEVYGGSFEEVDCNSVRGWAWDKNRPEANVNVELLADGVVVGSAVAKAYRADLKTAGYGTGNYGFSIPLPSNLKDGQAHSYSVRIQGTSYVLGGSPRSATCAVPSQYSGSFDVADCTGLKGWVWDKTYPSSTLTVEILEGGAVVASGLANIYRADLKSMGYGTGNYAFNIPLPVSLKDGQAHQLSARVKGSTFLLTASPRAMTCLPEVYGGSFEEVDCNSVRGWAWDKNRPEANVNVELLADGVVVGSAVAKAYRADLKTAGYGTGNYGFSIPLPSNLKDGQAHSYSVRIQGTSYVLGGSPRSATCAVPSQYSGSFDVADCTGLKGWVWDKTYPSSTLTVEILEGGAVVASGLANIYRADLKSMGYGTGNYAFNIPLPVSLKDGQAHQLSARVKGSNFTMGGSPKSLGACSPSARITELDTTGLKVQNNELEIQRGNEESDSPPFTLFPNPTSGIVTAHFGQIKGVAKLSVVNLVGRTVWEMQLTEEDYLAKQQIDLREFPSGIYVVKLERGSKTKSRRLVLVK